MATNIKHTDSVKYQKALTLEDRISLEKIMCSYRDSDGSLKITLNEISNMLEKDPTTLSKEVKNRRTSINLQIPNYNYTSRYCSSCSKQRDCKLKANISGLNGPCADYEKYICKHLKHFPWVCNGCPKRGFCASPKSYYNPIPANESYKYTLVDSRQGVYMTQKEFDQINLVVSSGLKKCQSIEHILHSNVLPISVSTAYNYLHRGYFNADITNMRRMRVFIKEDKGKPQNSKILKKEKEGRHYEDFQKLLEKNPGLNYFEMDTVEGIKGGKICLSLKLVNIQFQFYFIMEDKSAKSVVNKLNEIQEIIGIDNYKQLFGVGLTDNGTEFSDIEGMITDPKTGEIRTDLYFCHPQCSGEKGSCEKNHELFRYVIPKGHSFNHLNQKQFDLITSHVNSLKRKSTDFSTPIEKFYAFFGKDILDKLNINFIEPNDVILSRELIKN